MENASYSFSTQPYPPRQRFEVWREEVNALFDVRIGESESTAFKTSDSGHGRGRDNTLHSKPQKR